MRLFTFDDAWTFPVAADAVWAVVADTSQYPRWWTWIRRFDSPGLVEGTTSRCVVRSPLGYHVRFDVHLEVVEPPRRIQALVRGDISGRASLAVAEAADGCLVRLVWEVVVHGRLLGALSTVAPGVATWAHNRLVRDGVKRFRSAALGC